MAQLTIEPCQLKGSLTVPSSKSHTMRALLFAAMADGKSVIKNALMSADTYKMMAACQSFGAAVQQIEQTIVVEGIKGQLQGACDIIDAGNSGLILRFCAALSANGHRPVVITGDHSIKYLRPMKSLIEGMEQLGASAISIKGDQFAPLIVQGPLKHSYAIVDGEDSQFVSALLIAAAFAPHPITLKVQNAGEKPWVALTLDWFQRLAIFYQNKEYTEYYMRGNSIYPGFTYRVPGDFSSAAFPIAAALITGSELTIFNLDLQDCQGDKVLLSLFEQMGAQLIYDSKTSCLKVEKEAQLLGIEIDVNDCIDALPILAVVACFAKGVTKIRNGKVARSKESDRISAMFQELLKMGAQIKEEVDGLTIMGSTLNGAFVESHQDHRVAMALAIAAMGAKGKTMIDGIDCIAKSYPNFVADLQLIGAKMQRSVN